MKPFSSVFVNHHLNRTGKSKEMKNRPAPRSVDGFDQVRLFVASGFSPGILIAGARRPIPAPD